MGEGREEGEDGRRGWKRRGMDNRGSPGRGKWIPRPGDLFDVITCQRYNHFQLMQSVKFVDNEA